MVNGEWVREFCIMLNNGETRHYSVFGEIGNVFTIDHSPFTQIKRVQITG